MIRAVPGIMASLIIMAVSFTMLAASTSASQSTMCQLKPVALPLFGATPASVIAATPNVLAIVPELDEDGATNAIEHLLACAGEESQDLRYAIFTDRYLASLFLGDDPADQPAFERMIEVGALPEPSTPMLAGVSDLELVDQARIAVTVDVETANGMIHDRLVLAWDADQEAWLIDKVVSLDPPVATPAA